MFAARNGNAALVEFLLDRGADISARNEVSVMECQPACCC
jgi:ankyrin repeat protein